MKHETKLLLLRIAFGAALGVVIALFAAGVVVILASIAKEIVAP